MALALANIHSFLSLPNTNTCSFTSQFPNKTIAFSHLSFSGKRVGRDLIVAQVTEVVAPTSDDKAVSEPKVSKKKKAIKYPRRVLDQYQVLQFPIITEAAVKNIAEENTLLFTVDVRADKQMIKDAVKNLFGVKVRKVNTAIRPDGTKKAHIMLSKENNASDLAKKIGIFPSSD